MDDFSIFGSSFDVCLSNLEIVLKRCVDTNLILNWEKCHFIVTKGIGNCEFYITLGAYSEIRKDVCMTPLNSEQLNILSA